MKAAYDNIIIFSVQLKSFKLLKSIYERGTTEEHDKKVVFRGVNML